jgi:hypothetical protein
VKDTRRFKQSASICLRQAGILLFLSLVLAFCFQVVEARGAASDEDLKRGAEKFIKLVEARDIPAVLDLFSEQGTSFISGTYALPKASYSRSEIRKDFESKNGAYCIFFDTACLREADSKERLRQKARPIEIPLTSVIDLVANAKTKKFVTFDASPMNGMVGLILTDVPLPQARQGRDALVFYFRPEDGQMKLRNIEFQ